MADKPRRSFNLPLVSMLVLALLAVHACAALIDLHWRQGSQASPGTTLTRISYAYDLMGNRIESVRTPRPLGGVDLDTRQEQASSYDQFVSGT
jgi:hypothetical protein